MATRSTRKRKPLPDTGENPTNPKHTKNTPRSSTDADGTPPKLKKAKVVKQLSSPVVSDSEEEPKPKSSQEEVVSKPMSSNGDEMSIVSWNVNGVKAWTKSDKWQYIPRIKPDVICLQEVKSEKKDFPNELKLMKDYTYYLNSADQRGYSGTAILTKFKPLSVTYGIGIKEHDTEGRVITAEFERLYLVTAYIPNSKRGLLRLDYRQRWDVDFTKYLCELDKKKPVILCGDLNVAHQEIDLANPKSNRNKTAGFSDEERAGFTELLNSGFIDSYRKLYPNKEGAYSWWSYIGNAREKNVGWRLDYFVVSTRFMGEVNDVVIQSEEKGSDHCPVMLKIHGSSL
ncbi:DNA-(apurinic or apyrimidinic site) lyase [Oopsacas minuta]|uniref:DNA repair nuclease/redox regulator APEX1 n=1 Tax=Oopsacas minuta TaxID=111878 RepID=A0AAV7K2X0_9METZ|nr:DNA-(apurinic or apyrimidinic site) lyase [Oopsacas minuta]